MEKTIRYVVYGLLFFLVAAFTYLIFFNYFYEGDIRSKISGVRQNLRNCALAIQRELASSHRLPQSLAPTAKPQPLPEAISKRIGPYGQKNFQCLPEYYRFAQPSPKAWLLINTGPDKTFDLDAAALSQLSGAPDRAQLESQIQAYLYDPSNGTRSGGDLVQVAE